MQIMIPSGRHQLTLEFKETPLRKISNGLSIGAVILLCLLGACLPLLTKLEKKLFANLNIKKQIK